MTTIGNGGNQVVNSIIGFVAQAACNTSFGAMNTWNLLNFHKLAEAKVHSTFGWNWWLFGEHSSF